MDNEQRRWIVEALLGRDEDLRFLYHDSAEFHQALDTLAGLLPPWVDGLAVSARASRARRDQMLRRLVTGPGNMRPGGAERAR